MRLALAALALLLLTSLPAGAAAKRPWLWQCEGIGLQTAKDTCYERLLLADIDRWVVTEVPLAVEAADTFMPAGFLEGFRPSDSRELGEGLKVAFYERAR